MHPFIMEKGIKVIPDKKLMLIAIENEYEQVLSTAMKEGGTNGGEFEKVCLRRFAQICLAVAQFHS